MNTNDYVKYITQTVVQYMDQPKEERQKSREYRKKMKPSFMYNWFGMIPYALFGRFMKKK